MSYLFVCTLAFHMYTNKLSPTIYSPPKSDGSRYSVSSPVINAHAHTHARTHVCNDCNKYINTSNALGPPATVRYAGLRSQLRWGKFIRTHWRAIRARSQCHRRNAPINKLIRFAYCRRDWIATRRMANSGNITHHASIATGTRSRPAPARVDRLYS